MGKKILIIIASILLIAGLVLLLFPPVSNFIGKKKAQAAVEEFDKNVASVTETVTTEDGETISSLEEAKKYGYIDGEGYPVSSVTVDEDGEKHYGSRIVYKLDLDRLLKDSLAYNERLLNGQGNADTIRYDRPAFDLKTYGIDDGVYCYLSIDAIDMSLPVYLGANDDSMSYGAGHLYGTSLPVGQGSANIAFAGHTDYIGRIFFDNIRSLKKNDVVKITTYWGRTEYKVIDMKQVKEDESDDLLIQNDRRLLTLITCIYAGNDKFDRYLVICEKA